MDKYQYQDFLKTINESQYDIKNIGIDIGASKRRMEQDWLKRLAGDPNAERLSKLIGQGVDFVGGNMFHPGDGHPGGHEGWARERLSQIDQENQRQAASDAEFEAKRNHADWHHQIQTNGFDLSPEHHAEAMRLHSLVHSVDHPADVYDPIKKLHDHLKTSGVDETHPAMRNLSSDVWDARSKMYKYYQSEPVDDYGRDDSDDSDDDFDSDAENVHESSDSNPDNLPRDFYKWSAAEQQKWLEADRKRIRAIVDDIKSGSVTDEDEVKESFNTRYSYQDLLDTIQRTKSLSEEESKKEGFGSKFNKGLDYVQYAGDVAGIADPTGIVDLVNAGISVQRANFDAARGAGNYIAGKIQGDKDKVTAGKESLKSAGGHMVDAGLRAVSAIPYAGDAFGKTILAGKIISKLGPKAGGKVVKGIGSGIEKGQKAARETSIHRSGERIGIGVKDDQKKS